jgi:hypothetical protein
MCDRLPLSLSLVVFSLSLSLLCLCAFCSYGRLVREGKKCLYLSRARERKIRDWSSTMIGREVIVLCNFWTNNIWRERSIARDFLFTFSKHLLTFTEYKREKKKKRNLSITCLVYLFHKRGR